MAIDSAIQNSINYLASEKAAQSIRDNPYWPKWDSPWWHMSLLFEIGMAERIPKSAARLLLLEIKRTHLPYFFREEAPAGKTADQDAPCPCAFGNIYQILCAAGQDVDAELPWARGWFLKYQMPDGGLNCDEDAYKAGPGASSIVGTLAPLEAILKTRDRFSNDETLFLDRGAQCLIERELRLGSQSAHNAEERLDEVDWLKPCFPRFYLYDVLRGLSFILLWSQKLRRKLPRNAIRFVLAHLSQEFPEGQVLTQRQSFEGINTRGKQPASSFELLGETAKIGQVSPFLTQNYKQALALVGQLEQEGLLERDY